jgi:hypothetical protein
LEIIWKESVMAHFKELYQHLTGRTNNVKLGIAIETKLSQLITLWVVGEVEI